MFLFEFLPLEGLQLVKSNLLIQLFLFLALRQLQKIKPQMELSVPGGETKIMVRNVYQQPS